MQVKEVMSRRIIAISPEETVAVAARLLSQHNIGALPVCSRDRKSPVILMLRMRFWLIFRLRQKAGRQYEET